MKKNILIASILIVILNISSFAQEYIFQARPMDSRDWGFVNLKGDYIISPQYRKCYSFSEDGYALIYNKKEGYFFINTKGEKLQTEISKFKLKEVFGYGAKGFIDGFVAVFVDGKWGYINTNGELAIPAKYSKASIFKNGYAIAQIENDFYIIDNKGNQKIVEISGIKEIKWFSEELAPFKNEQGLSGFLNSSGEIVIQPRFLSAGYFNKGLAWVKTKDKTIGYINEFGEWVIQPKFDRAHNFDSEAGLVKVMIYDEWVYANENGEIIRFSDSDYISEFYEGLAKGRKNDKLGFYNNKLEWVIQPQFDGVRNFKNGYAVVRIEDKWGVIDKQGNWIIQPTYAAIKDVVKLN
jgi:WG containing repeat